MSCLKNKILKTVTVAVIAAGVCAAYPLIKAEPIAFTGFVLCVGWNVLFDTMNGYDWPWKGIKRRWQQKKTLKTVSKVI